MPSGLAVVTGASRGLGQELAMALAREGYDLTICARGRGDLDSVYEEIKALGQKCLVWQGDLKNGNGHGLIEFLKTHPIEVLVNNAAYTPALAPLEEVTTEDFYQTFALNLEVPLRLMQAAIRSMKPQSSGTIVNICSLSGRRAIRNASIYSASKFALRGMTEAVAQELDGTGIRCFSVSPGGMNTSMRQELFQDAAQQQDPAVVAKIIAHAIKHWWVPQGGDLVVRGGKYAIVPREHWIGITRSTPLAQIETPPTFVRG